MDSFYQLWESAPLLKSSWRENIRNLRSLPFLNFHDPPNYEFIVPLKNLQKLELLVFDNEVMNDVPIEKSEIFSGYTSLICRCYKNLTTLAIFNIGFCAETLNDLGNICVELVDLQTLSLQFCVIDECGLESSDVKSCSDGLSTVQKLREFYIALPNIDDFDLTKLGMNEVLKSLVNLPMLVSLYTFSVSLKDDDIADTMVQLMMQNRLSQLKILDTQVNRKILDAVKRCTSLKKFELSAKSLDESMEALFTSQYALGTLPESLSLSFSARNIPKFPFITIDLSGVCSFTVKLETLNWKTADFVSILLRGLVGSVSLTELSVEICSSDNITALDNVLKSAVHLKHLELAFNQFSTILPHASTTSGLWDAIGNSTVTSLSLPYSVTFASHWQRLSHLVSTSTKLLDVKISTSTISEFLFSLEISEKSSIRTIRVSENLDLQDHVIHRIGKSDSWKIYLSSDFDGDLNYSGELLINEVCQLWEIGDFRVKYFAFIERDEKACFATKFDFMDVEYRDGEWLLLRKNV